MAPDHKSSTEVCWCDHAIIATRCFSRSFTRVGLEVALNHKVDKLDVAKIRAQSLSSAGALGYSVNDALPLLDASVQTRSIDEIVARMLCSHAAISVAFGLPADKAIAFLRRTGKEEFLTSRESSFLLGKGERDAITVSVEALWALAWCVNLVPELDFSKPCSNRLKALMPEIAADQKTLTGTLSLRGLRSREEIVAKCDLAYCLHWSIADALVRGERPPGKLHPAYVIERRRALEWVLSDVKWEDVQLDTWHDHTTGESGHPEHPSILWSEDRSAVVGLWVRSLGSAHYRHGHELEPELDL